MIHLAAAQTLKLITSSRGAPVDAEVGVTMGGLPARLPVIVGFGSLAAHELLAFTETNAEGAIAVTVKVPYWAELDGVHLFFYAFDDQRPRGFSDPFHVTAADGTAKVTGTLNGDGVSCLGLTRDPPRPGGEETLYTLQGATGTATSGTRVTVVGTVAGGPACSGQGLPISVREIRPL
jgi:hypothetical protein